MTTASQLSLTSHSVETSALDHGAGRAVADALGLTFNEPAPLPPPLPRQPAQNFIARHWRGEYSLPRAFWINHMVLGSLTGFVFGVLGLAIKDGAVEQPVRWLISLGVTWSAVAVFSIWAMIGVWRSAKAYRRDGKRFWGAAARLMMAFGLLQLVYSILCIAIPQAAGIAEILAGDERIGTHQFRIMSNGTMLDFSGGISFGTAKEFETMLNAMENVRTVRLNSNGGRVAEAQKISDLIRARGLSTYVTHQCASACTIVFLGGKQRYLFATAKLGFHQSSFLGMTADDRRASNAREEARLQKVFGLSSTFAQRANAAPPSSMWFPEQSELLREHVVTSIVTPQPVKPAPAPAAAPAQVVYLGAAL